MPRDLTLLRDILCRELPGGERLSAIRQMTWGLSNATYELEGMGLVMRMPPDEEGLLPPYDLERQYAIYRTVAGVKGAPPVPPLAGFYADVPGVEVPFYLMKMLPGESFDRHTVPEWITSRPTACAILCKRWLEAIVKVHRLPADTLVGLAPRRTMGEEAAHWLEVARANGTPALAVKLLERFAVDPPEATGPATTVHGDPNLTNLLWSDPPRVIALMDWELSLIGEPFQDIAFMLTFFRDEGEPESWGFPWKGWWSKPHVVATWEEAMGRKVHRWRDHELFAMARLATILRTGEVLVTGGRKTDSRLADVSDRLARYMVRMERRMDVASRLA